MSLNGLDATVVNEAHQSALSEGGGWWASLTASFSTAGQLTQFAGFYSITPREMR